MINRVYWEEACALFSLTKEEQNLAAKLMKGPMALSEGIAALGGEISPVFGHTQSQIFLYPVFISYVKGELPENQNGSLPMGLTLEFPERENVYGAGKLVTEIGDFYQNRTDERACLVLSGEGNRFLACQAAYQMARPLLFWDGSVVNDVEVMLTTVLYQAIVCLDMQSLAKEMTERTVVQRASGLCQKGLDLLVLTQDIKLWQSADQISCLFRFVPTADEQERNTFVNDYLETHKHHKASFLTDSTIQKLTKESFSIYTLQRILKELELEYSLLDAQGGMSVLPEETVWQIAERYRFEDIEKNGIKKLTANKSLQDLCLPKEHHKKLSLICDMLKKRDQVLGQWGFSEKYSYGNGVSILFYGAPGTGKTMAAQAIAAELSMPLYRVDLSALISKYIGETQKNIAKVFEQTKKMHGILLFDEADALFSRRNEVNDAQDKYANAETAYLLQRIEESDGICILTTNLLQNFDEAFRRRITYMINFPMPDAQLRKQLWEGVFPKETPLSDELDFELLADSFELSGAAIRNAAMQSAWMAAAKNTDVKMQDILGGIANEYRKMNRALKPDQKALMELYDAMMF